MLKSIHFAIVSLDKFRVAHHIKLVSSSQRIGEGIFERDEVDEDLADNSSSKLSLEKAFFFMKDFTVEALEVGSRACRTRSRNF